MFLSCSVLFVGGGVGTLGQWEVSEVGRWEESEVAGWEGSEVARWENREAERWGVPGFIHGWGTR